MRMVLTVIAIMSAVMILALLSLPVFAAGTPDPCKATSRVMLKRVNAARAGVSAADPLEALGDALAVQAGAEYARSQGTAACYRVLIRALRLP